MNQLVAQNVEPVEDVVERLLVDAPAIDKLQALRDRLGKPLIVHSAYRSPMMSNAGCWKQQLAALAIGTSLLSGCAKVGSEIHSASVCPPVVDYSREFQTRATEDLALLPEGWRSRRC